MCTDSQNWSIYMAMLVSSVRRRERRLLDLEMEVSTTYRTRVLLLSDSSRSLMLCSCSGWIRRLGVTKKLKLYILISFHFCKIKFVSAMWSMIIHLFQIIIRLSISTDRLMVYTCFWAAMQRLCYLLNLSTANFILQSWIKFALVFASQVPKTTGSSPIILPWS